MSVIPAYRLADDPSDDRCPSMSDRELVSRCLQGDQHSYVLLYRRYQLRVRSTLYQLCGADGLDDLVQEVFLRVWKGLPRWRQQAQFSTWLYRITWNVAVDRRREFTKYSRNTEAIAQTFVESATPMDWMQMHYQDLVQRGLESLSFDQRAVIVLHDLEDVPQKEIAAILNIPVGTVKSRLFHARAAMRKYLEQQGVQL